MEAREDLGSERGGQKGGQEDRGPERGGGDGRGRDRTRPASETPRGKFGKGKKHGTAAADARTLGPWGSLSVSMSKRVKSAPGGPFGGSRWCVGAGPTGSLRVPDP